jgi:hypothetical protein
MGLLRKFSSREAKLPENFLPRGKQSFPRGSLSGFPRKFNGSYASSKFSPKGKW